MSRSSAPPPCESTTVCSSLSPPPVAPLCCAEFDGTVGESGDRLLGSSRTARGRPQQPAPPAAIGEAMGSQTGSTPGLMLQRLVRSGVEDQWLQLRTVYQRDDLAQHDQMIARAIRLPQPAVERRCGVGQDRAPASTWFEGDTVEHRRAAFSVTVRKPPRDVLLSGGEHI